MPAAEHRLVLKNADAPGYNTGIDCYLRHGGYGVLKKALTRPPEELVEEVKKSGLRGRGGAAFPCGTKWAFLDHKSGRPVYLICNADESEPGTFKDRQIIYKDPHQLIEGMAIAAYAIQARTAFIYIRGKFFQGARILEKAIAEARAAGFLGADILGSGFSLDIIVHRGAGAYIGGEETALIESIEGKRACPRIKPPNFPAINGLYQCPTAVNNVETLCHVKHVVDMGAEAYARIGRPENPGTHIICVSGHVQRPGYFELACNDLTVGQLIFDVCGGLAPGRRLKAVIPGGSSSKVLRAGERYKGVVRNTIPFDWGLEDIPLCPDAMAAVGSMSGTWGFIVLDDTTDMLAALANINAFYACESCGQCTPCREGSLWMKRITTRMAAGDIRPGDAGLLLSIAGQIAGRTICAFGEACSWPTLSFVEKFRGEFTPPDKTTGPQDH